MPKPNCDILIIGSGAAGLIAALALAEKNFNVLVITKDAVTESSSAYAQGGIAVPLLPTDSPEKHIQDTLKVGLGLCEPKAVEFFINKITDSIQKLSAWGIPFSGYKEGKVAEEFLGHEAAHSERRILKVDSDLSGRMLMKTLWEKACRHSKISISQGTFLIELLKDSSTGAIQGGIFQDINNSIFPIYASATILATGGLSSLYLKSTNPAVSVGDGIACAYRAGAIIRDLEFIQFHPTALDYKHHFLLSEALRGEGAILVNALGERFMQKYAPESLELSSRAVVSQAVWQEIQENKSVYLDIRHLGLERIKKTFNGIYSFCKNAGFDLSTDLIPITPAAHYTIGGIKTDLDGKTNLNNLWAIGEVASTGLHGADRLASNSLLECIVSGFQVAENINQEINLSQEFSDQDLNLPTEQANKDKIDLIYSKEQSHKLKIKMWELASFNRTEKGLNNLLDYISSLEVDLLDLSFNPFFNQMRNQVLASKLLVKSALQRPYSLGSHQMAENLNLSNQLSEGLIHTILK